jgi:TP901 family phage tail tape measure protein
MAAVQLDAILRLTGVQVNQAVFRQLSQLTAGINVNLKQTVRHTDDVNRQMQKANKTTAVTARNVGSMSNAARTFLQRMAQFAVLLPAFATLNRSIQGGAKFLVDFEQQLLKIIRIDIQGLSDQFGFLAENIFRIGINLGASVEEVADTVRVFKQAGFSIEEAFENAEKATLASQVTTLGLAQAQELLIQVSKQFRDEVENTSVAVDVLAKVEDSAAVNAQDVAEAFRTGGNALAEFAKSFEDSVSLVAALTEQTRKSGREVGTFFKTLQTRLFAAGEARDAVEGLGVSVENLDGSLRPTLDVLNDLKTAFDGLTEAQAASAAKSIAGVRQFESLTATLNSLERANELTAIASEAQGTSDEKLAVVQKGLGFQIQQTIGEFQKLAGVLGQSGILDFFRSAVEAANQLAKGLQAIVGLADGLGASLGPLGLVGAVAAGRSIFGARGSGGSGGGGGSNFKGFNQQLGRAVTQINLLNTTSATQVTAKRRLIGAAIQASDAFNTTAGKVGLIAAAMVTLNTVTKVLTDRFGESDSVFGDTLKSFDDIGSNALNTGLSFGLISAKAGLVAGSFTAIIQSGTDLAKFFEERSQQLADIEENERTAQALNEFRRSALQGGEAFADIENALSRTVDAFGNFDPDEFVKLLTENIELDPDKAGLSPQVLEQIARSSLGAQILPQIADKLAEQRLGGADAAQEFIDGFDNALRDADVDLSGVNRAVFLIRNLFAQIGDDVIRPLNTVETATGAVQRRLDSLEFDQNVVRPLANLRNVATELRAELDSLNAELANQDLGFDPTTQERLQAIQTESQIVAIKTANSFKTLSDAISDTGNQAAGQSLADAVRNIVDTAGPEVVQGIDDIKNLLRPEVLSLSQFTSQQVNNIIKAVVQSVELEKDAKELDLQEARIRAEERIKLANQEREAAEKAAEGVIKFNDQLIRIGGALGGNLINDLQGFDGSQIQGILDGTISATAEIERFVKIIAGDPITQANEKLKASLMASATTIDAYKAQLDALNSSIQDAQAGGRRQAGGVALDEALKNREKLEQKIADLIRSRDEERLQLTIKRVQAQFDQQKKLAEEEKKRIQALEELEKAQRKFNQTLGESRVELDRFIQDQQQSGLDQVASAQSDLKSAQQDVLSSTQNLSDAFFDFNRAVLEFNDVVAEGRIESNLIGTEIANLTGEVSTFQGRLTGLNRSFNSVLEDSNLTLQKRIELERQLAEETIAFLEQAKGEIVNAGLTVFGQTGEENAALQTGIQGLEMIAQRLGGSFESFLGLSDSNINQLGNELLNLPVEFRRQILDALNLLPSSVDIGGFSVEQLETAIGQLGAGAGAGIGLPSIEDLTQQQVAQLERLQGLAERDAELQFGQLFAAREQLDAAKEQLDAAEIAEERARENLMGVQLAVLEQTSVLQSAQALQNQLTDQIIQAGSQDTLNLITREAELFREQNSAFAAIGDNIVQAIRGLAGARAGVLGAAVGNGAKGFIPNFAGGNLSLDEISGLIQAAAREKRAMPGGAGLAVANDSEIIIPTRNKGHVPNFQGGSDIAAGIESIKGINETVVAAIARSVTQALTDVDNGDGQDQLEQSRMTNDKLDDVANLLDTAITSLSNIETTSATTAAAADTGNTPGAAGAGGNVAIDVTTNQQSSVTVTGLENLRTEIEAAIQSAASEQIAAQLDPVLEQIEVALGVLRENSQLSSLGQSI